MTVKFRDYNAANEFANKSGFLNPSKPWRQLAWINGVQVPMWCVTLVKGTK